MVIDVNQPATQSAGAPSSSHVALALLWLPLIAGMGYAYRRHPGACRLWILIFILLGSGFTVVGCSNSDSEDELRFVVNLPANGLTNDGQRLGPESAIEGTTIRLMQ